jgi:hypothetical protein
MQAQHRIARSVAGPASAAREIPYLKMHFSPDLLPFLQILFFHNN